MNIRNYTSFFHDGSIFSFDYKKNSLVISMESAEINKKYIQENMVLSKNNRITGKLHVDGIKRVKENKIIIKKKIKMKYEDAEVFDFKLSKNKVLLQVVWDTIPPQPCSADFSTIEIEADNIWWENIPNLEPS